MTLRFQSATVRLGGRPILHAFDVAALPGTVTAVVGPNAAGKSTLLRAAAGLVPLASGTVSISDPPVDPGSLRPVDRARGVAWVPARPDVALPFTVREVVAMGRHAVGRDPAAVATALEAMDLSDVADQAWPTLSTGQQQRAAIARSLAQRGGGGDGHGAGLWLLDEPAAALDLRHVVRLGRVLRAEADAGATVLVTMHDLGRAADWADAVWILDSGRLVAAGPARDTLAEDRLLAVFGVPMRWIDDAGRPRLVSSG